MKHLGNYLTNATLDFTFTTTDGVSAATLTGGTVAVFKGNSTTESSAGVTLTANFDGVTGLNHVRIDLSNAFYTTVQDYSVVLTAGTVAGTSLAGSTLATFSVQNRGAKLVSDGLDLIPVTPPAGVASTFREMVVQTWRRMFKKVTLSGGNVRLYADDNTAVQVTQPVSDDGTTQTQGPAA